MIQQRSFSLLLEVINPIDSILLIGGTEQLDAELNYEALCKMADVETLVASNNSNKWSPAHPHIIHGQRIIDTLKI